MARTSGETLSTSFGKPCSLARYISPSNSSRTGQKSFSKASRLENIAVPPVREDALQPSNEGLTLPAASRPGNIARGTRIGMAPGGLIVGWVERSETHRVLGEIDGFRFALPILRT